METTRRVISQKGDIYELLYARHIESFARESMAKLIVANGRKIDKFGGYRWIWRRYFVFTATEILRLWTQLTQGRLLNAVCFSISSSCQYCDKAPVCSEYPGS